jgi:hypothetical protein
MGFMVGNGLNKMGLPYARPADRRLTKSLMNVMVLEDKINTKLINAY